jgi:hypothetical protein
MNTTLREFKAQQCDKPTDRCKCNGFRRFSVELSREMVIVADYKDNRCEP